MCSMIHAYTIASERTFLFYNISRAKNVMNFHRIYLQIFIKTPLTVLAGAPGKMKFLEKTLAGRHSSPSSGANCPVSARVDSIHLLGAQASFSPENRASARARHRSSWLAELLRVALRTRASSVNYSAGAMVI